MGKRVSGQKSTWVLKDISRDSCDHQGTEKGISEMGAKCVLMCEAGNLAGYVMVQKEV